MPPPEMPDVIGGETITEEWGNDIRDRTLQRYANAADRTTLIPTPTDGDLSFLDDTGRVYVYNAGTWATVYAAHGTDHTPAGPDPLGDHGSAHATTGTDPLGGAISGYVNFGGGVENADDSSLSGTFEVGATVTFNKPATWTSYAVHAWGAVHFLYSSGGTPAQASARMTIGGVTGGTVTAVGSVGITAPLTIAVVDTRSGLTGDAVIAVQYAQNTAAVDKEASSINYITIRTT